MTARKCSAVARQRRAAGNEGHLRQRVTRVRHRCAAAADAVHALRIHGLPALRRSDRARRRRHRPVPARRHGDRRRAGALTGRPATPLNPANGLEAAPTVAFIDEERCIGCTKCLPPCPVDAIVGAPRRMHTVIAELCTGCELCVAPCPVDCIIMVPLLASPLPSLVLPPAQESRARYEAHNERMARRAAERAARWRRRNAARGRCHETRP